MQPKLVKPIPARNGPVRFLVLFLVVLIAFGNQYSFNNPQALQDSMETILDIQESQFQLFYSLYALPNIFTLPFVGYFVDKLGIRLSILVMSISLALCQLLIAIGAFAKSYQTILIGRILFGVASQGIFIPQASITSFWFHGKELAFALGIAITFPQFGNAFNSFLTPILFEKSQNLGVPFLFSVFLCCIGIVAALIVVYIDRKADQEDQQNLIVQVPQSGEESQEISLRDIKQLKVSYWLIAILCTLAMSMYVPFMDNVNRLFQKRFCFTQVSAGSVITITYLVTGAVSIPLGMLVDYIGKRRYFIMGTILVFTIAHLIILLYPQCLENEQYGAVAGLLLIGVGYSGYANCITAAIPLVVKKKVTGTAFGLMQVLQSIVQFGIPIITGLIVQNAITPEIGYRHSSVFFVTIGFVGILTSLGLNFLDNHIKHKLDRPSRQGTFRVKLLDPEIDSIPKTQVGFISQNSSISQSLLSGSQRNYETIQNAFQIQSSKK